MASSGIRLRWRFIDWRGVIFHLGKYNRTAGSSLYVVWFLVEWQTEINLRTITAAVEQVALAALCAVLGEYSLDEILKLQETISGLMEKAIDGATERQGRACPDEERRDPALHAALHGPGGRGAAREARLIKAEAELAATEQLGNAAEMIMQNSAALELRRMQMITEVGAEQNTMTIVMMPSEFVILGAEFGRSGGEGGGENLRRRVESHSIPKSLSPMKARPAGLLSLVTTTLGVPARSV